MKSHQAVDITARDLSEQVQISTYLTSKAKTEKRKAILDKDYADADKLRETAGLIKQHTLEYLDKYLAQAEAAMKANGVHVHFAVDGDAANVRS
jgi:L-lactate dehydrogenase complex protein LldF